MYPLASFSSTRQSIRHDPITLRRPVGSNQHGSHVTHTAPRAAQGVSPDVLIQKAKARFLANGGTLLPFYLSLSGAHPRARLTLARTSRLAFVKP
eukprot:5318610-Pyramimonas_sp.AAC.3